MNRTMILVAMMTLATFPIAQAETVILKNGGAVSGKILEKDEKKVKLDVSGVVMTYYMDEVEWIDGLDPMTGLKLQSVPATVVPRVQPPVAKPPVSVPPPGIEQKVSKELSKIPKRELILKFIEAFGTREGLKQNFVQLIKSSPPAQALQIQNALDLDLLIEGLIPVYDKYFTQEELEAYVNFYSSPEGQKLIKTVPLIMGESVGVSLKYFKERLPQIPTKEIN